MDAGRTFSATLTRAALRLLAAVALALIGLAGPAMASGAQDGLAATCHAAADTQTQADVLRTSNQGWTCGDRDWSAAQRHVLLRFDLGIDGQVPAELTTRLARFEALQIEIERPDGVLILRPQVSEVKCADSGSTWTSGTGTTFTLSAGSYTNGQVRVRQTDAAGNLGSEGTLGATVIDTTAPVLASASVSGTTLTLTYTEAAGNLAGTTPAAGDFSVTKGSGNDAVTVTNVSVDASAKTVTLTLGTAITNADTNILIDYTPGTNKLQDIAGNEAASFTDQSVTNGSGDTTPPAAPSVDLVAASDTGSSSSDDYTNDTTPTIRVTLNGTGVTAPVLGDVVKLYEGSTEIGSATLSAGDITNDYVDITASALTAGSYSLTAKITDAASNTSAATPITPSHSVSRRLHLSVIHQQNAGSITG